MNSRTLIITVYVALATINGAQAQDDPPLPAGLSSPGTVDTPEKNQSDPELPVGLPPTDGPQLPSGLDDNAQSDSSLVNTDQSDTNSSPFNLSSFSELRIGSRIGDDTTQESLSVFETRVHLEIDAATNSADFHFAGDFILDGVDDELKVDLEKGRGVFDLREANVVLRPAKAMDVKIGRQVLTWGVGDLLFINDLFPKDFRSFFIGRDDEYLKAPSDAVRISAFHDVANVEVVYTPRFDADRSITGERLSYFSPALNRIAGRDAVIDPQVPDAWFSDDEVALRIFRNIGGFETAFYGYSGFWKTPQGQTPDGRPFHPRLNTFGASIRGPLAGGIATAEVGHYQSKDDPDGNNPLIRNGETRFLVGIEREIAPELTGAIQFAADVTSNYGALKNSLPTGFEPPDKIRQVVTLRATKLLFNQNLTVSGFNFYSPNEKDGYLRLRTSYKLNDAWLAEIGGNVFYGEENNTFFNQFEDNSNLFVSFRFSS